MTPANNTFVQVHRRLERHMFDVTAALGLSGDSLGQQLQDDDGDGVISGSEWQPWVDEQATLIPQLERAVARWARPRLPISLHSVPVQLAPRAGHWPRPARR